MDQLSEQKLIQLLLEAHADELMLVHTLTAHVAMTPAGDYRDALETHLTETKDHARRIQDHLAKHERSRGIIQLGYGMAQGMLGQVVAMTKFPVDLMRGVSGEEKLLRNARDECASEAMEIATYLAIEEVATAVGDTSAARLARSIRSDEERMLARLLALIPRLANDALTVEVEGAAHFDLRTIGAVDAVRSAAGSAAKKVARSATRTSRAAERSPAKAKRSPSPASRTATGSKPTSSTKRSTTAKRSTTSKRSTTAKRSTKAKAKG